MAISRSVRSQFILIIVGLILAVVIGVWLIQSFAGSPNGSNGSATANAKIQKIEDRKPQLLETSDSLTRYVDNLKSGTIPVKDKHIYLPEEIDWNDEVVVAIQFMALDAHTFTSATVEEYEGEKTFIIDLIDVPEGCSAAQVSSVRAAFIKQTSRDINLPVIMRTTPNSAKCPS